MQDDKITGLMFYYYFVCKRKLWFFTHNILMEADNEDVKIGKMIDEKSYTREKKHFMVDNVINIDFLEDDKVLHEVKKSRAIEEANIWQVKYYLYYLEKKNLKGLIGKIDYPLLRKCIKVELSEEDKVEIEMIISEIGKIKLSKELPKKRKSKRLCQKCAFYDICYI